MSDATHSAEDTPRQTVEKIGIGRVRRLLAHGAMVQHLIVPAYQWLDEIDAKEGDHAAAERQE